MISLTSPVRTAAHDWPAGAKLAGLVASTVVLVAVTSVWFHLAAFAGMVLLYCLPGRTFLRAGLGRLLVLWPFLAIVLIWHIVTEEPAKGAVIALRMATAVGLANLVTMTTRLTDMTEVVRYLLTPARRVGLDSRALEIAIALVIRLVPAMSVKAQQLFQSWAARSARKPRWQVLLPLTLLAIDDADHIAEALRARGGITKTEGS